MRNPLSLAHRSSPDPVCYRPQSMSKPRRFYRDIDGILLLDKALGLSSNGALQDVRALFGAKKAGHAGSLDPLASGLLPVCFGQATKVCGRLLNSGKSYAVSVRLGARTESGDMETAVVERAPIPELTLEKAREVLKTFEGEQLQIPPMHSALKFEGKRLYQLARSGKSVERPPRSIVLRDLELVSLSEDVLEFRVHCSKGTYIRTLAMDLASRLGTLGYVQGLRRLSVEPFGAFPMYSLAHLISLTAQERDAVLLSADAAFADLPRVDLDAGEEKRLLLGQPVPYVQQNAFFAEARAYGPQNRFLGLVQSASPVVIRPVRLFTEVGAAQAGSPAQATEPAE
jgi:tRNA pseudouridine55 synthase